MKPEKKRSPRKADTPSESKRSTSKAAQADTAKASGPAGKTSTRRAAKGKATEPSAPEARAAGKPARSPRESAREVKTGSPVPKPVSRRAVPQQRPASAVKKAAAANALQADAATQPALEIPPILLEGDVSPQAPVSGPGQRYALGPTPSPQHFPVEEGGELPEGYGTRQLFLTARDPRWLYAYWDLTAAQIKEYNGLSADKHLIVRVHKNAVSPTPVLEVHVHPESRNWFVPVDEGGTKYVAELGYYDGSGRWTAISTSAATFTPPDTLAEDTAARFATIPIDVPFQDLLALVQSALREHPGLVDALEQLRQGGTGGLPGPGEVRQPEWTPEQERALASVVNVDHLRRVWIGSLEITELIRRQLLQEISSRAAAELGRPTSPIGAISSISSISSPFGARERQRGFWFNVNAELIIYGATEPDAKVNIGGRSIKLRPDGTFSFRFILPDGNYDLAVTAVSADEEDARAAQLRFNRATNYRGEVGAHPQDQRLKTPEVAHVA